MENTFIVSARKYRPTNFDSVIGQFSITTTLKSAIKSRHLAQAYLFCGPRGVGKTTCARILAKTINCSNLSAEVEACNQCESCLSFIENRSYSIHELDAASNNSVDDIRNLIEQVRVPPQIGQYSIYIIDEVHMLSTQAFNAFLKTLEEPPKHAIFILATTEKHKIIPTILSRCQIFDFNRITVDDTTQFLAKISASEGIEAEPEGLNIIAQKADGAMRDALSIFDQVVSFSGKKITYKGVIENLNVLDYEYYFKMVKAFLASDTSSVLLAFNEIIINGFDPHNFLNGMSKHFRDLMVCKDPATITLFEVGAGIKEMYLKQALECPVDFIFEALKLCNQFDINYKNSRNQRLHVELCLVQLSRLIEDKKKNEDLKAEEESEKKNITAEVAKPTLTNNPPTTNQTPAKSPAISLSLKEALRLKPESINEKVDRIESPKQEIEQKQSEQVSQDNLKQSYTDFVEKLRSDRPRFYSLLSAQEPELADGNKVILKMENNGIAEEFNKSVKPGMIPYLRAALKNDHLDIDIIIAENSHVKTYKSAEEKYKELINKYPMVHKLRQQFNLDFD